MDDLWHAFNTRRQGRFNGLTLLVLVWVLAGCDKQDLRPVPPDGTILAFGDSLTYGLGVNPQHSYPSVLAQLSGRDVVNAGISGETTEAGRQRLPEVLAQTRPNLLILLQGGNDILRNANPAQAKANLAAMIELARGQDTEVVLVGVPARHLFSDVAPFYRELAEQYQLVFEDSLVAELLREPGYKSDAVHFNRAGYRLMAESLHQLLVDHGAL